MKGLYKTGLGSAFLMLLLHGCKKYEDYETDTIRSVVYFAYQKPVRTLVATGNSVSFDVGVVLGGKRENTRDEKVQFSVEPALLSNSSIMGNKTFTLLPAAYYSLSNNTQIVIPSGSFEGSVKITLNENFLNDPAALTTTYALPLRISSATTDTVLRGSASAGIPAKDYAVMVVKYVNAYQGTWYHRGFRYGFDAGGNPVDTLQYVKPAEETQYVKNHVWNLATSGRSQVLTDGVEFLLSTSSAKYSMQLNVENNGNVSISNAPVSLISNIVDNGNSRYDAAAGRFYLNYQYNTSAGKTYKMKDTLIFRNIDLNLEQW